MDTAIHFAQEGGEAFIEQELTWVILLSIAALVAIVVRRIRLPYTVALVLVGLFLTLLPSFAEVPISSELILALLVPPLLFEATLHVPWVQMRRDLAPILLLAVAGSLIGALIVGGAIAQLPGISLPVALVFGALISATDPVAVIAFFRQLGVSKRLAILIEGESLFNDGVAVVLFGLFLSLAGAVGAELNPLAEFLNFIQVAFGGLAVGLVLGYIVSNVILKNVDDHLIETATTFALAFGSYIVAEEFGVFIGNEELHLSGILAVVAAGLMVGNIGTQNTSPTTRLALNNFWELVAFVVNSLVFLVIGLEINITEFTPQLGPVALAVLIVLLARAIVIYGLTWVHSRLNVRRSIPAAYRHVLYWGGLRGAISLALALTLTAPGSPMDPAVARQLQLMTFGVVLFTLLVQGTTIEQLIRHLRLAEKPPQTTDQQRRQALLYASQAGRRELDRLHADGILPENIWQAVSSVYRTEIDRRQERLHDHLQSFPELEQELVLQVREDLLRTERVAIGDALRRGLILEEVHDELIRQTDNQTAALELTRSFEHLGQEEQRRADEIVVAGSTEAIPGDGQLNRIVVAIRGGAASRAVKQRAVALAQQSGAVVLFLYVVDVANLGQPVDSQLAQPVRKELYWQGEALLRLAQQRAKRAGVSADIAIVEGPVQEAISRFVHEQQADLLLLGAPRDGTANVFGDDAIEQFALLIEEKTGVPVEVVRPKPASSSQ